MVKDDKILEFGLKAKNYVKNNKWENVVSDLEEIMSDLIERS